jgi:hypothetical protein
LSKIFVDLIKKKSFVNGSSGILSCSFFSGSFSFSEREIFSSIVSGIFFRNFSVYKIIKRITASENSVLLQKNMSDLTESFMQGIHIGH